MGIAVDDKYLKEIEGARSDLRELIKTQNCAPIMLRLAFHDAGNFDAALKTGGANGSIRFLTEYSNSANNGIKVALDFCEEVHKKHPIVTYADLYQLAGVVAVEVTGGPKIDLIWGRKDSVNPDAVRLPTPFDGAEQLKLTFHRMGLSNKDIVALSGSHTLGRAHKERSGFDGPFTKDPYIFDNSYFSELKKGDTPGLVKLPSDKALLDDPELKKYVSDYAENKDIFFKDYAESHKKMSELGFTPNS